MNHKKFGYMDATDFNHELGQVSGGVTIYPSEKDILHLCPCAKSCGVVKVSVELVDDVIVGNNSNSLLSSDIENKTDAFIESEKSFINHCRQQAIFYQEQSENCRKLGERRERRLFKLVHPTPKINNIVDNTAETYAVLIGAKHLVCCDESIKDGQIYFSNVELDINNNLVIKDKGDWRWVCKKGHNKGFETPEDALDDYLFFMRDPNWLR